MNPIALYYRQLLKQIYGMFLHGESYNGQPVTIENVNAVADEWIAFMRETAKAKSIKKFKAPTRAYLIRSCS